MIKLDILAVGAHPDDVELGCGGTLAKEIANGKKIGILDLTRGELGTRGDADIRENESRNASNILNISIRENLNFEDCFFNNDKSHQLQVIKIIRKYKPEVVFCNAISDRHIDHSKASNLVSDSCFMSGLVKIETELNNSVQEIWRPKIIYHYIQWDNIKPDIAIDISDYIDLKLEAVKAYKSQFYDSKNNSEKTTPISTKIFLESITYRARDLGRLTGVGYAEGFNLEKCPLIDSVFDIK